MLRSLVPLAVVLLVALCGWVGLNFYAAWREADMRRYCAGLHAGDMVTATVAHAQRAGLEVDSHAWGDPPTHRLLIGRAPFATLFHHCCLKHDGQQVEAVAVCVSE